MPANNPLPCDLDSEKCLIGTLLLASGADEFGLVCDYLTPEDFFYGPHKHIWRAMLDIHEAGQFPDRVTVASHLGDKNLLGAVGGMTYLCDLDGAMGTVFGVQQYAERIKTQAIARKATVALQKIQNEIATSNGDPEVLQQAEKLIQQLNGEAAGSKHELKTGAEIIQAQGSLDDFLRVDPATVPTPFPELTRILQGGLRPGQLAILAARPSVGKTSLAMQFATRAAKEDIGVAVFSLETKGPDLLAQTASQESGVSLSLINSQNCPSEARRLFMAGMSKVANLPIFYDDNYSSSVAQIANVIRQHKAKGYPIGLVIVDYLQLMATGRRDNRNVEIGDITRGVKKMLAELNLPGLILSQLRRPKNENEDQGLEDLRDSGSIEQDADLVMILQGKEEEKHLERRPVVLRVKKQRRGPVGKLHLNFRAACTLFELGTDCEAEAGVAQDRT